MGQGDPCFCALMAELFCSSKNFCLNFFGSYTLDESPRGNKEHLKRTGKHFAIAKSLLITMLVKHHAHWFPRPQRDFCVHKNKSIPPPGEDPIARSVPLH